MSEYELTHRDYNLTTLSKLPAQWNITFEFMPEACNALRMDAALSKNPYISVFFLCEKSSMTLFASMSFSLASSPTIECRMQDSVLSPEDTDAVMKFKQFPETDKWTRMEVACQEEDDGQFFSVEGRELGRTRTDSKERADMVVGVGRESIDTLPWAIRRLTVLEKQ